MAARDRSYPGEGALRSGRRRVMVGAIWISLPFMALGSMLEITEGSYLVGLAAAIQVAFHAGGLVFLGLRPQWIGPILMVMFTYDILGEVWTSYLYGGLVLAVARSSGR